MSSLTFQGQMAAFGGGSVATSIAAGAIAAGAVYFADGTAAAPSIAFANDHFTGFYNAGNAIGVSISGGERFQFTNSAGSFYLDCLDNRIGFGAVRNVWMYSAASGTVSVGDGTNQIGLKPTPPSSSTDSGAFGSIAFDSNYIYICTAANTWKRVAIAAF